MTNETNSPTAAPQAIIMVGGPGAGKGYVISRDYPTWAVLDSDSIKAEHPDYDEKDPAPLHAWSAGELTKRLFSAMGSGEDFVLDGTGTSVERYAKQMDQMAEAGYEITLVYVRTSLSVALRRNAARSRNVPESIVREKHAVVEHSYRMLASYATATRVVEND